MCMRELLRRDAKWKYFMNPAASELPLVTVDEMENTLRAIGGNIVESYPFPKSNMHRLRDHPVPWRNGANQVCAGCPICAWTRLCYVDFTLEFSAVCPILILADGNFSEEAWNLWKMVEYSKQGQPNQPKCKKYMWQWHPLNIIFLAM